MVYNIINNFLKTLENYFKKIKFSSKMNKSLLSKRFYKENLNLNFEFVQKKNLRFFVKYFKI